jgi:NAD(P)-dependent dehydrogenase (short-subunit alcohol dehydrogenase family)
MGKLDGKVAIVTGGGRGIGRAIAEGYMREGCLVVVTAAREQEEIDSFVSAAGKDKALALLMDVSDYHACEKVISETISHFGRIDVLVNNAGRGMKYISPTFMTEPARFWNIDPETWKMVIDTNVNGPFFMSRAAVPHMMRQKNGAIINVTINYETMKRKGFSPYGPSKAALESETIIWAQDLENTGITVNEILPGGVTDTGMVPSGIPPDLRARLLKPETIVPLAVFLASDAGRIITGRRLTATRWSPEKPDGVSASNGIGAEHAA